MRGKRGSVHKGKKKKKGNDGEKGDYLRKKRGFFTKGKKVGSYF